MTSHSSVLLILAEIISNTNFYHFPSIKSKRATQRILKTKRFATLYAFHTASKMQSSLNERLNRVISLALYSNSLFYSILRLI